MGSLLWKSTLRFLGNPLHQLPVDCPHASSSAPQRTSLVADHVQMDICGHQFSLFGHQPCRLRLLPVHRTTHHRHLLLRILKRGQPWRHCLYRTLQPLVSIPLRHRDDSRHLVSIRQTLCRWTETATNQHLSPQLLHYPIHRSRYCHPYGGIRHERRFHPRYPSHHHQQRQSVRPLPSAGFHRPQHTLLHHTDSRQENLQKPPLLPRRGGGTHFLPCAQSLRHRHCSHGLWHKKCDGDHHGKFLPRIFWILQP